MGHRLNPSSGARRYRDYYFNLNFNHNSPEKGIGFLFFSKQDQTQVQYSAAIKEKLVLLNFSFLNQTNH